MIGASLIEAESGSDEDSPLISAVITNRLKRRHAAPDRRDPLLREGRLPAGADRRRPQDRLALQHLQGRRSAAHPDRDGQRGRARGRAAPGAGAYKYYVVRQERARPTTRRRRPSTRRTSRRPAMPADGERPATSGPVSPDPVRARARVGASSCTARRRSEGHRRPLRRPPARRRLARARRTAAPRSEAIAALLHDALEDTDATAEADPQAVRPQGRAHRRRVHRRARDGELGVEARQARRATRATWRERKERSIAHLAGSRRHPRRCSACRRPTRSANARSIVADLRRHRARDVAALQRRRGRPALVLPVARRRRSASATPGCSATSSASRCGRWSSSPAGGSTSATRSRVRPVTPAVTSLAAADRGGRRTRMPRRAARERGACPARSRVARRRPDGAGSETPWLGGTGADSSASAAAAACPRVARAGSRTLLVRERRGGALVLGGTRVGVPSAGRCRERIALVARHWRCSSLRAFVVGDGAPCRAGVGGGERGRGPARAPRPRATNSRPTVTQHLCGSGVPPVHCGFLHDEPSRAASSRDPPETLLNVRA